MRAWLAGVLGRIGVPPWVALLVLSAALFLAGSASFALSGGSGLAQLGVFGAVAAVAVIAAFL